MLSTSENRLVFTAGPVPAAGGPARERIVLAPAANRRFETVAGGARAPALGGVARVDRSGPLPAEVVRAGPLLTLPVRETLVHDALPEPPPGPAVVRVGLLRRLPTLTPERFRDHYLDHHAPLVMARGPLFDRYSVSIVTDPDRTGWDAVVEQWFADEATWREHDRLVMEEKPDVRADIAAFVGGLASYAGHRAVEPVGSPITGVDP